MIEVIAIASDNLVRLDALTNASTGAYVNNATCTFTLKDSSGNVFQALANVSMPYVGGTNGRYEGTIPNAASSQMAVNSRYTCEVTANVGGTILFRKLSCVAQYRAQQ